MIVNFRALLIATILPFLLFGCSFSSDNSISYVQKNGLAPDEALVLTRWNIEDTSDGYASITFSNLGRNEAEGPQDIHLNVHQVKGINNEEAGKPVLFKIKSGYIGITEFHHRLDIGGIDGVSKFIKPGSITYIGDINVKMLDNINYKYVIVYNKNTIDEAKIQYPDIFTKYNLEAGLLSKKENSK